MNKIPVLYDGWSLVHQPNSPAALHLIALLENLPHSVQPILALPGKKPEWLAQTVEVQQQLTPARASAHLAWEQRTLAILARRWKVRWLHSTSGAAPLSGKQACLVSPTDFEADQERPRGLIERVRRAFGAGGVARSRAILWPSDLPAPKMNVPVQTLPPLVSEIFNPAPQFQASKESQLPESFLLYHGPGSHKALNRLLEAWFWAASSIGEYTPLVLAGLTDRARWRMKGLLAGTSAAKSVRFLAPVPPAALAEVYRQAQALFHPAMEPPWGGPIRHALACGKPVVASHNRRSETLVGPAAYLAAGEDGRGLGAALITVVVEESIARQLSEAAVQQASQWDGGGFAEKLEEIYQSA
ncbi:MAG: glycosyltransferase [Anaerolineales bacterium]|nr:glycosyltransferase [Anaerolineales bacterium]